MHWKIIAADPNIPMDGYARFTVEFRNAAEDLLPLSNGVVDVEGPLSTAAVDAACATAANKLAKSEAAKTLIVNAAAYVAREGST